MEQNIQQQERASVEQTKLPIKTKIAAYWMKIIGALMILIMTLYALEESTIKIGFTGTRTREEGISFWLTTLGLIVFFLIFRGFGGSLLKRKNRSWLRAIGITIAHLVTTIILFCVTLVGSYYVNHYSLNSLPDFILALGMIRMIFIPFEISFIMGTPIIFLLLLLDRKNFWKVAK